MSLTSRRKRPLDHTVAHLRDTRLIIIAAEGEKTETQYFSMFRNLRVQVKVLHTEGGHSSPKHVFERLAEYKKTYDVKGDDELWLVIDVDRWTQKMLSDIAAGCLQKGFGLAVSNPCFEIWLYLHCGDIATGSTLTTQQLEQMLKDTLGSFNKVNLDLDQYRDHVQEAVDRAVALDTTPDERWPSTAGTHVYKVTKAILDLLGE
jgi:hypothetical protein